MGKWRLAPVLALLMAALVVMVLVAGGTKSGLAQLFVLPAVIAVVAWGTRLGLVVAAISGIVAALLPFDTLRAEPQPTSRWVVRFIVFGSVVVGFTRKRLMDIAEARSQFISRVGHELRTPLTSVVGFSEALYEHREELAEPAAEMVSYIRRDALQISHSLDQMIVAARLDTTNIHIESEVIDLRDIIVREIENLPPIGRTQHIDLSGNAEAVADNLRTSQVVRNLLVHAALADGGATRIVISSGAKWATVELSHEGGQLDETDQHLFSPIFGLHALTAPSDRTPPPLALSVSRQLARLMGGDLIYHFGDNRSTFHLTLPQAAEQG